MPTTNATPRQFGRELSQNVRRGRDMTVDERNIAIGMLYEGASYKDVAARFSRDPSTIRQLYNKLYQTGSILSRHQQKLIYRAARSDPKILYEDLAKVAVFVHLDILKRRKLTKYCYKKRPKLTPQQASRRYRFIYQYQEKWKKRILIEARASQGLQQIALKDCWRRILGSQIKALIESMPRRLRAYREARGWQTK
ncbi:hypothetical protein J3E71DRAFT_389313 [Bipolaris maydis]|nr:hypothetical protein J3E73DRAFT_429291 [Bipolaris maydis]KAJ6285909.1 hypothetical protein J3E71DRAFT_389313 [Bipolaris maydis]